MLLLLGGKKGQIFGCRAGGGRAARAAACRCGRAGAFRRVRSPGWRACWSRRHARGVSGLVCCARNAACAVRCSARARLSLGERWAQGRQWACATRGLGSRASEHGAARRGAESCAIRVSANAEKSFFDVDVYWGSRSGTRSKPLIERGGGSRPIEAERSRRTFSIDLSSVRAFRSASKLRRSHADPTHEIRRRSPIARPDSRAQTPAPTRPPPRPRL